MATKKKLLQAAAGSAGGGGLDVNEVFSTYLHTGTGATKSIVNGIDLAGEGGLVWSKGRSSSRANRLIDTERGVNKALRSDHTSSEETYTDTLTSFNSDGFSLGADASSDSFNRSGDTYATWAFRKAPLFFDVQKWSGTGAGNRYISHDLEAEPGCILVKSSTDYGSDWVVYHKDADGDINLNTTEGQKYLAATSVSLPSSDYNGITYNPTNNSLVTGRLYKYNGTANAISYSSNGGTTWTNKSTGISGSASNLLNMSYANGYHYLAVHDNGGTNTYKLLYSADGSSWAVGISMSTNTSWGPVRYAKNLGIYFVTTQNAGYYWTSTNGTSWTQRNFPSGVSNMKGAASGDVLVAFKNGTSSTYYTSTDGINWTSRANPFGNAYMYVASSNGDANNDNSVILINSYNSSPSYSYDGVNWSGAGYLGSAGNSTFSDVMHYANGWYAFENGNGNLMRTNLGSKTQIASLSSMSYAAEDHFGSVHTGTLSKISASKSISAASASSFAVNNNINNSGEDYVSYLFAANNGDGEFGPSGDADVIKCGGYTGNGSTGQSVDLGFEPQWLLLKDLTGQYENWIIIDNMRGWNADNNNNSSGDFKKLWPDATTSEGGAFGVNISPTGFDLTSGSASVNASGNDYIWVAIRRGSMSVPSDGSEVFSIDAATQDTSAETQSLSGYDSGWFFQRSTSEGRSAQRILPNRIDFRTGQFASLYWNAGLDNSEGKYFATTSDPSINYFLKRAPGFFDHLAYKGTGSVTTHVHNLTVTPEMMWVRKLNTSSADAMVYHKDLSANTDIRLNTDAPSTNANLWNNTRPTDVSFTVGTDGNTNDSGNEYFYAMLFASVSGVSKVGSYTGNGSSQAINCGFGSGARFVLIRRADAGGYNSTVRWYIWDATRGITGGSNPRVNFYRETTSEFSDGSISPQSSGFTVNEISATNINVSGASYIFYAIS